MFWNPFTPICPGIRNSDSYGCMFIYRMGTSTVLLTAAPAVTQSLEDFMSNTLVPRLLSTDNGAGALVLSGAGRFSVDRSLSEVK